jgi:dihydroorotase-like cyclic amidohydrolase
MDPKRIEPPKRRIERPKRGVAGIAMLPVVVLVGLLAAGAFNYHRNWQAEAAVPRPYEGYSQADLEALMAAYQAENAQAEARYEAARGKLGRQRGAGMLDQNIAAFEAAQRDSAQAREAGARLAMQKTSTDEIEAELARREADADVLKVHLRRLLTI